MKPLSRVAQLLPIVFALVAISPAAFGQGVRRGSDTDAVSSSRVPVSRLSESISEPVLIQVFDTAGASQIALAGERELAEIRALYSGPMWILYFDSTGMLLSSRLSGISRGVNDIFYGRRYSAVSGAVPPNSIIVQITVVDHENGLMSVFSTGLPYVAEFLIHDGLLYVSTEKTLANVRRFDLETGEEFQYEGLFVQNPTLVVSGDRVFAVTDGQAFELMEEQFQETELVVASTEPASENYSVHKRVTEYRYFDSWEQVLEAAPFQ